MANIFRTAYIDTYYDLPTSKTKKSQSKQTLKYLQTVPETIHSPTRISRTCLSIIFHLRKKSQPAFPTKPPQLNVRTYQRRIWSANLPYRTVPTGRMQSTCRMAIIQGLKISCRDPGFTMVARLKEHLYRRHLLPIQCNRCCSTFPNDPALRDHQRDPRGCQIREQIPLEGFNKDQERKLKSKKRSLVFQSEEEKWKIVYRILFPDDNETDMPCPYIEYQPSNTSVETSNIARFQEFSRLELPRLVRRTLEVAIEREAQPLEDKLKDRFVDIVRECQSQLITMFQGAGVSLDAADIPPLLPAAAAAAATATTASSSSAPTLGPPSTSEATPAPAAGQSTATPAVNVPRFFAETSFSGFDSSLPLSLPEPIIPPHSSSSSSSSFIAPPNPTDTPASAHSAAQRSSSTSSAAEKPRGSPDSGYSSVNMENPHYPYSNNGMSHGSGVSGLDLYPEPHPHPQLPFDPHQASFDAFDDYVDLGGCYGVGDASAVGAGDTSMWAFLNDGSGLFGEGEGSTG
ncbi:hypothetical protein BS50DRAFT_11989 [Corynespora cassiicola Philippines]|uniref:C2H2-type domain-containing protein n=1 Tax=Corynespora cassiicola Philippines TaxID=1448308 RepID=A0A2T2P9C7_CORCC|nr:hypothetical protein BS50DRAFT_11989 [Corynespora cassiicola Philippines]